jgi:two-component system NtrC family sensor kinase
VSAGGGHMGTNSGRNSLANVRPKLRAEAKARSADAARLEVLGTLVAGVAHEINNPLAGEMASQALAIHQMKEFVEILRGEGPLDREDLARRAEEVLEMLANAQMGAKDIATIVSDLASFGRVDAARAPVRLSKVVASSMRWLRVPVEGSAEVRVEAVEVPAVLASPGQIEQVVVNLVTNAAHAIPKGRHGTIVIRIGPGGPGMVRLEVVDDGMGMVPQVIGRIFEPFFTTGGMGKGTGLGLPISRAIVTAHGGTLTVTSEVGKGSTFRMELPAIRATG